MSRIDSLFRFVGNWIKDTCKGFVVGETTVVPEVNSNNLINLEGLNGIDIKASNNVISVKLSEDQWRTRFYNYTTTATANVWTPVMWSSNIIPANNGSESILYRIESTVEFGGSTQWALQGLKLTIGGVGTNQELWTNPSDNRTSKRTYCWIYEQPAGASAKDVNTLAFAGSSNTSVSAKSITVMPIGYIN